MDYLEICKQINSNNFKLNEGLNVIEVNLHLDDIFGNPKNNVPLFYLDSINNMLECEDRATRQLGYNVSHAFELYSITYK